MPALPVGITVPVSVTHDRAGSPTLAPLRRFGSPAPAPAFPPRRSADAPRSPPPFCDMAARWRSRSFLNLSVVSPSSPLHVPGAGARVRQGRAPVTADAARGQSRGACGGGAPRARVHCLGQRVEPQGYVGCLARTRPRPSVLSSKIGFILGTWVLLYRGWCGRRAAWICNQSRPQQVGGCAIWSALWIRQGLRQ